MTQHNIEQNDYFGDIKLGTFVRKDSMGVVMYNFLFLVSYYLAIIMLYSNCYLLAQFRLICIQLTPVYSGGD